MLPSNAFKRTTHAPFGRIVDFTDSPGDEEFKAQLGAERANYLAVLKRR
jgi:hypothetical protein